METVGLAVFAVLMGISAVLLALLAESVLRLMGRIATSESASEWNMDAAVVALDRHWFRRVTPFLGYAVVAVAGVLVLFSGLPFAAARNPTMERIETINVVGIAVLAMMLMLFFRLRKADTLERHLRKYRSIATIVSRSELAEGMHRIPVVIALTMASLFYENAELEASIELRYVDEVEYSDETGTGHVVAGKVLRLRAHGHAFEFILDMAAAKKWMVALPPREINSTKSEIA